MSKQPYLFLICFLCLSFGMQCIAFGQPIDPQSGGDPDVPITGIELLLGAGGLLGARKAYLNRKKK